MDGQAPDSPVQTARIFRPPPTPTPAVDVLPSSSPAFATPIHPVREFACASIPSRPTILPVLIPPATLRPLAFRTFTKKHNLTLSSSALQALATFIGKHCGTGWREEGLGEKVLEEVARQWKKCGGAVIVDGEGVDLKGILKNLEESMHGGRIVPSRGLSRQNSLAFAPAYESLSSDGMPSRPGGLGREDSQSSMGLSALAVEDEDEEEGGRDVRKFLRMVGAFEQPRLNYNTSKKHFEKVSQPASLLPPPSHKTNLFRHRYNLIHQRLLRNERFQTTFLGASRAPSLQRSSSLMTTTQSSYKLTPVSNLLGRSGSNHLILGLLTIAPAGTWALSDLTGSIGLDLRHVQEIPRDGAWFGSGMVVLVDGMYEELGDSNGVLGGGDGVGGTIGGRFIAFSLTCPPCERRELTLGSTPGNPAHGDGLATATSGFGWIDFLGVGSERAVGSRMRRLEQRVLSTPMMAAGNATPLSAEHSPNEGRNRLIVLGEVTLDSSRTLAALRKVLSVYAAELTSNIPMAFTLAGNFVSHPVMTGGGAGGGGIEYKEAFDALASVLADFPRLLQNSTFIFIPGDNDPWASAFSAGAAPVVPRRGVPEMFTSRIKRAFASANAEARKATGPRTDGEAIWTTNPARLSLFGPTHEIVFFRDDMIRRLRRNSIYFEKNFQPQGLDEREQPSTAPETVDNAERMELDSSPGPSQAHIPSSPPLPAFDDPDLPSDKTRARHLHTAQKLSRTVLDQGYLSPFPLNIRPVHWDFAPNALSLYPLPTALVLIDAEAPPFAISHEGCAVLNPGRLADAAGAGSTDAGGARVPTAAEADPNYPDGRPKKGKDKIMAQANAERRARAEAEAVKNGEGKLGAGLGSAAPVCRWVEYVVGVGGSGEGKVREERF